MATFKIAVIKHQQRRDGFYPVSIRVTWQRKSAYIKTEFYVGAKQITKSFELKDAFILRELNNRIAHYEELKKTKLGIKIYEYEAKDLADFFVKHTTQQDSERIDFIAFAQNFLVKLREKGKKGNANSITTTLNAFIDFVKSETFDIKELTSKTLNSFEEYLRSPRMITRPNQFGKMITIKKPGVGDTSIKDYMTNMRTLFNAARNFYNDPEKDEIKITHYPFATYKVGRAPLTQKRALSIEDIKKIRDANIKILTDKRTSREQLSRDVFMLSFYLVGMNSIDLYELPKLSDNRIEYNRAKTKGRRQDAAFISIAIPDEALPLIEKYKDKTGGRVFCFYNMYSDSHIFGSNIAKGLKQVAQTLDIEPFTFYAARHSFATIARNDCECSMDDISICLNHVDTSHTTTDIYIKKDWSIIDRVQKKVLDIVK